MSTLEPVRNLGESIVVANLDGPSTTSCIQRTVNKIVHAGLETLRGQGLGFLPPLYTCLWNYAQNRVSPQAFE